MTENKEIKDIKTTLKARIIPNLPLTPKSIREDAKRVIDNFEWDYYFKEYNQKIKEFENEIERLKSEKLDDVAKSFDWVNNLREKDLIPLVKENITLKSQLQELTDISGKEIIMLKKELQEQRMFFTGEELKDMIEEYKFMTGIIQHSPTKWLNDIQRKQLVKKLKSLLESEKEVATVFRQPKVGELEIRNYTTPSENSKGEKKVEMKMREETKKEKIKNLIKSGKLTFRDGLTKNMFYGELCHALDRDDKEVITELTKNLRKEM